MIHLHKLALVNFNNNNNSNNTNIIVFYWLPRPCTCKRKILYRWILQRESYLGMGGEDLQPAVLPRQGARESFFFI